MCVSEEQYLFCFPSMYNTIGEESETNRSGLFSLFFHRERFAAAPLQHASKRREREMGKNEKTSKKREDREETTRRVRRVHAHEES